MHKFVYNWQLNVYFSKTMKMDGSTVQRSYVCTRPILVVVENGWKGIGWHVTSIIGAKIFWPWMVLGYGTALLTSFPRFLRSYYVMQGTIFSLSSKSHGCPLKEANLETVKLECQARTNLSEKFRNWDKHIKLIRKTSCIFWDNKILG